MIYNGFAVTIPQIITKLNSLSSESKYDAKILSKYDEIHDVSPQATGSSVEADIDLTDYFSSVGLKSVVFFACYLPGDDVTTIKFTFDVGYVEGSISSVDKFVIQYFDGTTESSYVLSGKNASADVGDKIELSFSGNCAVCKLVVNHVN